MSATNQDFGRSRTTVNQGAHQPNHLAGGRIINSNVNVSNLNQDLRREVQNKFQSINSSTNLGGQNAPSHAMTTDRELQRTKFSNQSLHRMDSTQILDIDQSRGKANENQSINAVAKYREGLTEFLRSEYYRRLGVYINRARDEQTKLIEFFHAYVSIEDKRIRQEKLAQKNAKQAEFTFQKPAIKPATKVDEPKSKLDMDYEKFGSFSALDVGLTVERDLQKENNNQSCIKSSQLQKQEESLKEHKAQVDKNKAKLMLHYYFVWCTKVKVALDEIEANKIKNKETKAKIKQMQEQKLDVTEITKRLIPIPKGTPEELEQQAFSNVKKKFPLTSTPTDKPHVFFSQLVPHYIDLCYSQKIKWNQNLSEATLIEVYRDLSQGQGRQTSLPQEKEAMFYIQDFLKPQSFFKRLRIHKEQIKSATAKVNAKLTDSLYFVSLNEYEKWVNLLNQDGEKLIQNKEQEEKRKVEAQQKLKEDQEKAALQKKKEEREAKRKLGIKEYDEKRMDNLAKPKDKWKKGRVLKELQKEFPHDRVLERMIKDEFAANQLFRYPQEYDVYNNEKDEKLKNFPVQAVKADPKGDRERLDSKGIAAIENFKARDRSIYAGQMTVVRKQNQQVSDFERAMIMEAQDYLQASKQRLDTSVKKKTLRQSLGQIYSRLREQFFVFVVQNYPMMTDNIHPNQKIPAHQTQAEIDNKLKQQEKAEKAKNDFVRNAKKNRSKSRDYKSDYEDVEETVEPEVREYPVRFKRQFFRIVKALIDNKPNLTQAQKKRRIRQLPTSFMISGQLHTFNQKVIDAVKYALKKSKEPLTLRQRVFYREDKKDKISQVFMTQDDQINCTFEPKAAALLYKIDSTVRQPDFYKLMAGESAPNSYTDKLGENFKKSHPEVYKAGKLKKAQLEYNQGDYKKAMSVLTEGFNIYSLRRRFDLEFVKREKAQMKLKAEQNKAIKGAAQGLMKKLEMTTTQMENDEKQTAQKHQLETAPDKKKPKENTLERLRETVADTQSNMPQEDFENIKLIPILKEAFDLWNKLNKFHQTNRSKARNIQKQREELSAKKQKVLNSSRTSGDEDRSEFKTIMCPLGKDCPLYQQQKAKPSYKTSKDEEGKCVRCPYAHHLMELEFPETLVGKINSLKNSEKNIRDIENVKYGIHKTVFYPANQGEIRKGLFKAQDRNELKQRKESLYRKMKSDNPDLYEHLQSMHDLDNRMMKVKSDGGTSNRTTSSREERDAKEPKDKNGNPIFRTDSVGRRYRVEKDDKGVPLPHHELTVDFNYSKKFGQLKQASILMNKGRLNDAWNVVIESIKLIKAQKLIEQDKQQKIEDRWKTRLDLSQIDFTAQDMKAVFTTPAWDTQFWDNFYDKNQQIIENPEKKAAIKMYISQVSPYFNDSQYNKNEFLNGCIEELFYKIEKEIHRKSGFYSLLKTVQSKDRDLDEDDQDENNGDPGDRKSAYKKFRKSQKEGEEREEVVVWEYDIKFPYKKPRARTPSLCKTWYPERDRTYDDEGPAKIAESKRKRMELLNIQLAKDTKSKKDHLKTCKSAHFLYQLGNIRPGGADADNDDNKRKVTLKPWEIFERDPTHIKWTPASNIPYKDPSLFAPYTPQKAKGNQGQDNQEEQGNDNIFNPNSQTEIKKPRPKEQEKK